MTARARPGLAVVALGVILAVTAAWWALALVPAGAAAPEWLLRTRLACFGAGPSELPNAGGWLLLIGEPLGMLGVLVVGWRDALARDLRLLLARGWGVALAAGVAGMAVWGIGATAGVVRAATAAPVETFSANELPMRLDAEAPPLQLTDHDGRPFALAALHGRPVIVTFAYAHCEVVCPTVVKQIQQARVDAARADIPIVVVTLDPWRDVAARLPAIFTAWQLAPGDRLLTGEIDEVTRVLDAWGIGRMRDASTGEIDHAVAVMLVGPDGRLAYRLSGNPVQLRQLLPEL